MVQSMHIHDLVCSLLLQYHIPKYPKNPWCSKDCSQSPTSIILTMEMDSQESQIDTYKIKHTHSAGEVQCDGANSQHFCLLRRQISCVPSTSCSRSFVSQLTLIYMYSMVNGRRREGMLPFHINSGVFWTSSCCPLVDFQIFSLTYTTRHLHMYREMDGQTERESPKATQLPL